MAKSAGMKFARAAMRALGHDGADKFIDFLEPKPIYANVDGWKVPMDVVPDGKGGVEIKVAPRERWIRL